jgi:hypothetical protein
VINLVQDWRPLWGWIEQGLREVIERTHPSWVPADVYAELKSGSAVVVTVADDAGFMVIQRLQDYDGMVMFVWVMWGPNSMSAIEDKVWASLAEMARQAGCKRVRMRSPRKGWARIGWTEVETVYEREV